MRKIVHIDMDDTLLDFTGAYHQKRKENPGILYPQSQYGFFTGLQPFDGAIHYTNLLRGLFDVYILTRPSVMNPLCYTEKRVWVEKHFDLALCDKLIICPNKGLVKGDYLIDDKLWLHFEGEQLVFGSPAYDTWEKVYQYLKDKV
jgi:5'-nucleotidase